MLWQEMMVDAEGSSNVGVAANEQSGERDHQHNGPTHSEPRQTRVSEENRESSESGNSLIIRSNADTSGPLSRLVAVMSPNATHVSYTAVIPPMSLLSHQPHVSQLTNRPSRDDNMVIEAHQFVEISRVENDDMVTQVERKRRRAEIPIRTNTDEHNSQHFLSAGLGSSQDCRDL
ncbi:hypothetical protein A2U01_0024572 [Trifolium medium]|uniref:Uncharacterized protein n=1 Tax=Trifolium medium TaxID=97028 RepID=A0A392NVR0_9FABA|nr:hypothetical protein [Trifolium medium]